MSTETTLSSIIEYNFNAEMLLEKALTHPSLSRQKQEDKQVFNYERLEFLGDGVLGLIIAELLFMMFPQENEGHLAKRHAALVRGETVTEIARSLEIGRFMRLSEGEEQTGGRENASNLENTLEAIIGAIYLDGGIEPSKKFVLKHWTSRAKAMKAPPKDPKTALQEWAQSRKLPIPEYKAIDVQGPAHAPIFTIEVTVKGTLPQPATGISKKLAEKKAAAALLAIVEREDD
jgi:ribonuclease-3